MTNSPQFDFTELQLILDALSHYYGYVGSLRKMGADWPGRMTELRKLQDKALALKSSMENDDAHTHATPS
jgi:hypothetical protein